MTAPTDDAPDETGARQSGQRSNRLRRELPFLIVVALVLALLIKTFLVQAFYIPSASMENTLQGGPPDKHYDRVLVNRLIYRVRDPHRGEIVVFRGPPSWQTTPEFTSKTSSNPIAHFFHDIGAALGVAAPSSKDFIKRVIGVGGDTVSCLGGVLRVNGRQLVEPYLYPHSNPCSGDRFDGQTVHVPQGRLFVMGDHRDDSADSRAHVDDGEDGTIPVSDVIGRAFVVVWPPSDWKVLSVPSTFSQPGLAAVGVSSLMLGVVGAVPIGQRRSRRRPTRRSPSLDDE